MKTLYRTALTYNLKILSHPFENPMKIPIKQGLNPVVDDNSRILILGSLPGDASLKSREYYAYPQNQFWNILSSIYQESIRVDYESKRAFLRKHGIALWDVLKAAERKGSLDSNIRSPVVNDLKGFIRKHPQIRAIGLNGRKAWEKFNKHCIFKAGDMHVRYLPSSSSMHTKPLPEKVQAWQDFLEPVM